MSMTHDEMIAVIQAHKAGKRIEYRNTLPGSNHGWQTCDDPCWQFLDTDYRVAPDEPPKPSQAWLDKHGVEMTGECRVPMIGELIHYKNDDGTVNTSFSPARATESFCAPMAADPRWILRRRAPVVKPWGPFDIPVGAITRRKDTKYHRLLIVSAWTPGHVTLMQTAAPNCIEPVTPPTQMTTDALLAEREWCWPHEQFDNKWRPCGTVEGAK